MSLESATRFAEELRLVFLNYSWNQVAEGLLVSASSNIP